MSLKLIILGLLMERDMHPYEIRHIMKERHMDQQVRLQDGSLYYAVDQLRKEGSLEVVEVVKEANRPDRTVYRITDTGHGQFQELLLQQFTKHKLIEHPFASALPFADHGDQAKIAELIEKRIKEAECRAANMRDIYKEHVPIVPRTVLHLMAAYYMHAVTETKWLRRLHKDALEGRLGQIGEPLDMDMEE
jgi:DNA-binding PadR family transcriptional regulator